jgi:hypothetical protein
VLMVAPGRGGAGGGARDAGVGLGGTVRAHGARGGAPGGPGGSARLPVGAPLWVLLHGLTVPGLDHPSLRRFCRALARAGVVALVPRIDPWTALDPNPAAARGAVLDALELAVAGAGAGAPPATLAGFSFGAPQAVHLASDPEVAPHLDRVLAWGGYADLEAALRFGFTGEHETPEGAVEWILPDPYLRWIAGAAYLPTGVGGAAAEEAALALHALAHHAGDTGLDSRTPAIQARAAALRQELSGAASREIWDLFAPPGGGDPEPGAARDVAAALARAAREAAPTLDPSRDLAPVPVPVHLLHGRSDDLLPWSGTARMAALLQDHAPRVEATLTGLFGHSREGHHGSGRVDAPDPGGEMPPRPRALPTRLPPWRLPAEGWRLLSALERLLAR